MHRSRLIAFASLALLAAVAPAARAQQYVSVYGACSTPPDSTYAIWLSYDPDPLAYPNWVGYDVMRRVHPGCDDYVAANAQIIPRAPGTIQEFYFQEASPAPGQVVEYRIRAVDASHQEVFIPGFCAPCDAYVNCPALSGPMTIGSLVQIGSFVYVTPCPGTCYPAPYLDDDAATALAPYVGTSATFSFFGQVSCGSVEGCSMLVDHWESTTCVTPNKASSWGRLKTIYR